jgi:hypothetical protein
VGVNLKPIIAEVWQYRPVTVAEWSKACTVLARSEAGIVGLNSTQGMDVYSVCVRARARCFVFVYR